MIKVTIKKNDSKVCQLSASGHALFDVAGQDIVCSAVSSILIGGINAINEFGLIKHCKYRIDEALVDLEIGNSLDEKLYVIIDTMIIQLKTIEESYSSYISIQEV